MVRVAMDVGPLYGPRTGVGNALAWTVDALGETSGEHQLNHDVALTGYVVSMRCKLRGTDRRLPIPAALAHRLWSRSASPRADRFLDHPDVIHGTNYVVPPASAARIVTVHDCWFLEHPDEAHPVVARIGEVLRRSIQDGAHVLTCSDATTDRVRELLAPRSVETLYHGPPPLTPVDLSTPPSVSDGVDTAPFVLVLGTVERRKNVVTAIDAFARLAAEHSTVQLRLAGRDGDDAGAVAAAIRRLPPSVRRRVIRHSAVDEPLKHWLLDRASVLAYPSLDEGFGIPILEAQQVGTPVVGSTGGSIPEVAGAGALLSSPLDVDALAAHLFTVVTDAGVRAGLVTAGHANVERFSWKRTANELASHYRRVAGDT